MFSRTSTLTVLLGLAVAAKAHFTLEVPAPIGPYSDVNLINGPCDGYDPTTATTFQDYPWSGQGWGLITTHPSVIWEFNAALFSTVTNSQSNFIPLSENIQQTTGTGFLCLGSVPGKKEWVGQKAIVQIIQHAPDGALTSCVAVTFTDGPPASGGSNCFNNSGPANLPYDITWLPGTGSDLLVASSSTSTTPSSPTSSGTSGTTSQTVATSETPTATSGTETTIGSSSSAPSTSEAVTSAASSNSAKTTSATGSNSAKPTGTSTASTLKASTSTSNSNSTKPTTTSTASPSSFTGASDKTHLGSLVGLTGLIFGGLVALGL